VNNIRRKTDTGVYEEMVMAEDDLKVGCENGKLFCAIP